MAGQALLSVSVVFHGGALASSVIAFYIAIIDELVTL
jgi:hypothetical protein